MKAHLLRITLLLGCIATYAPAQVRPCRTALEQERYEAAQAKDVAAAEVGGVALGARRVDLNGSTGGWEVVVRVAQDEPLWRVVVDRDTWKVRKKERAPKG